MEGAPHSTRLIPLTGFDFSFRLYYYYCITMAVECHSHLPASHRFCLALRLSLLLDHKNKNPGSLEARGFRCFEREEMLAILHNFS